MSSNPGSVGLRGGRTRTARDQNISTDLARKILDRKGQYVPTLTEVFPSSSDARLPPPALLEVLIRLFVRGGRIMALIGRGGGDMPADGGGLPGPGGGEDAILSCCTDLATKCQIF